VRHAEFSDDGEIPGTGQDEPEQDDTDSDQAVYLDTPDSVLHQLYEEQGRLCASVEELAAELGKLSESQGRVLSDQLSLSGGFERLAQAVLPLVTRQYQETQERVRVLETRVRNRQERPLIIRIANLLAEVRRLESADDIKAHVEESLFDALTSLGYQEMGSVGDQFDPAFHQAIAGSLGKTGKVGRVYNRGLSCYGDVIIKARVEVVPDPPEPDLEEVDRVYSRDCDVERDTAPETGEILA
jgi:hypothetical protein